MTTPSVPILLSPLHYPSLPLPSPFPSLSPHPSPSSHLTHTPAFPPKHLRADTHLPRLMTHPHQRLILSHTTPTNSPQIRKQLSHDLACMTTISLLYILTHRIGFRLSFPGESHSVMPQLTDLIHESKG